MRPFRLPYPPVRDDSPAFLRLLIALRYVGVAGQIASIAISALWLELPLPLGAVAVPIGAWFAFNVATHVWAARHHEMGQGTIVLQLTADILALTGVLYCTGGPTNPFVSLYLLPVALGAIVLDRIRVTGLAVFAAAMYTLLLFRHIPLPHAPLLHEYGMWVNFLVSAALLVAFLNHFIRVVDQQRRSLASARESALRDESVLGLGFLAAGTAHELNTPLATMGLVLDEWRSGVAPTAHDIETMREQLARCRVHVRALAGMAKGLPDDAMGAQSARAFLERTIERWRLLRPGLDVDITFDGTETGRLAVDATLPQAFANLLNNAADASSATGSSEVGVEARLDGDRLVVRVLDRGPGPASVRSDTADVPSRGLGLGLLISNATIERFGGSVRQFVRDGGGCVTEIELPLLRDGVGQVGR